MPISSTVKMGFEGLFYIGTAGTTAASLMENTRDITEGWEHETGDTTVRGDGTTRPIGTGDVTRINYSLEVTVLYDTADTLVQDLLDAAAAGDAVSIRTKAHSSGKGVDADATCAAGRPMPLNGEQVITFTFTLNRGHGRSPQLNV
jgi:hypothetical protein